MTGRSSMPSARPPNAPAPVATVRVRDAKDSDALEIAGIYNEAVTTSTATFDTRPREVETQLDWLHEHAGRYPVVVAESESSVVGWASLSPWSPRPAYRRTAEISVYVRGDSRGRGVGRALMATILGAARAQGLHVILARVADHNVASLKLHENFGFRPVGTMHEVGTKFGRRIDVDLLEMVFPSTGPRSRAPAGDSFDGPLEEKV